MIAAKQLALLALLLLLPLNSAGIGSVGADVVSVPHSPANRVVAENLHATDQAFVEVHRLVNSLTAAYHEIRERFEAAILRAVRSFDPHRDNGYALVQRVRQLSEQLVDELATRVEEQNSNADELIEIAVELHDTNWNLAVDDPAVQEAMQLLHDLRDTKYGQVGALLDELRRQTTAVREQKLREALRVAARLRRNGGRDLQQTVTRLERVFSELLDEQRAIVLVNRARSQTIMAALEHQFRTKSLELTLAEQKAHREARSDL